VSSVKSHYNTVNQQISICLLSGPQSCDPKKKFSHGTPLFLTDIMCASMGHQSPLHCTDLVREFKLLFAKLSMVVEVLHVPRCIMIHQGTDALSPGLWYPLTTQIVGHPQGGGAVVPSSRCDQPHYELGNGTACNS